jgi:hypothetical protein
MPNPKDTVLTLLDLYPTRKIWYVPVKDKNQIPTGKFLIVKEGGTIHKKILAAGVSFETINGLYVEE